MRYREWRVVGSGTYLGGYKIQTRPFWWPFYKTVAKAVSKEEAKNTLNFLKEYY